jgi:hypothetical protein
MCNDANRDLTHEEMKHEIARSWRYIGATVTTEQKLENSTRADVMVFYCGHSYIFECKTDWRSNYAAIAAVKYGAYCDYLILVIPPGLWRAIDTDDVLTWRSERVESVGIFVMDWEGVRIRRQPLYRGSERRQPALRRAGSVLRDAVIGSPACTADEPYHGAMGSQIPTIERLQGPGAGPDRRR